MCNEKNVFQIQIFGSYQPGKPKGTGHKGRKSTVQSNLVGQDSTKSVYSTTMISSLL